MRQFDILHHQACHYIGHLLTEDMPITFDT